MSKDIETIPKEVDYQGPPDLAESEDKRTEELRLRIDQYYKDIPIQLKSMPETQERCLEFLVHAEETLMPPLSRRSIMYGRLMLTRIDIELARARAARTSYVVVVSVIYLFALALGGAFRLGLLQIGAGAKELNARLLMGVPAPVLLWSAIGSFTSMLLRAGQFPFADRKRSRAVVDVPTGRRLGNGYPDLPYGRNRPYRFRR